MNARQRRIARRSLPSPGTRVEYAGIDSVPPVVGIVIDPRRHTTRRPLGAVFVEFPRFRRYWCRVSRLRILPPDPGVARMLADLPALDAEPNQVCPEVIP